MIRRDPREAVVEEPWLAAAASGSNSRIIGLDWIGFMGIFRWNVRRRRMKRSFVVGSSIDCFLRLICA